MVTTGTMLGQSSSLSPFAGPYVGEMLGRGMALASLTDRDWETEIES